MRLTEHLDAVAPEDFFNFHCRIGVELPQNVCTALEKRDDDAEPREELRQLHRHRATAKDDQRFRKLRQFHDVVTGEITSVAKRG
jgi:hypothetical protein